MKYLITGVTRGFGRFAYEELGGFGLTRQNRHKLSEIKKVDTIIHCAYDKREIIPLKDLKEYLDSNIFLTKELLQIPHRKFIFLSTINVYPPSSKIHRENEKIKLNEVSTIYGLTKLMCEEIIKETNYLVLRCSGLLGKYSKNTLTRIINKEKINLSENSELNFILYEDVLDFIKKDKSGVYNIASSENIKLSKLSKILNIPIKFGAHTYQAGNIDNSKWEQNKTSEKVLQNFILKRIFKKDSPHKIHYPSKSHSLNFS